ncbi:hypothetical protein CGLO_13544 [Colletotrichum gloeosporioides Cg-14]|uniref:Uncharacterized protein n=1 Tax=Colletotrichum gloeosporioides (strain Cg-14) TaxID=1237896 RepID=T0LGH6_COLGC|nr:hypothetical protein CGLO_13544 [Colletotrichum gloeosporioides Cg-14]
MPSDRHINGFQMIVYIRFSLLYKLPIFVIKFLRYKNKMILIR